MLRYAYHCKKCGHFEECADKSQWRAAKSRHKTRGCRLVPVIFPDGKTGLMREELVFKTKSPEVIVVPESNPSTENQDDIPNL